MKNYLRRILSCALALSLTCALAVPAAASDALGEDLTSQNVLVNQDTQLSTNVFWSSAFSDLRTENMVTYTPNTAVTPIVTYGGVLTACNSISSMAKTLEGQGYRVVAGINGDYYNVNNGLPIGIVVTNGELKSTDGGYYAIGFRADGTAVLGKPGVKVTADLGYELLDEASFPARVVRQLGGVNKARVATGGIYLYTYDFNSRHTTGTTDPGVELVCTIQSGSLAMNGSPLVLTVDSVLTDAAGTAVPEGKVVLSVNNQSDAYHLNALKNVPVGATLTLNVSTTDPAWSDVQHAVGSLYSLVQNGAVSSGLENNVNPRTAVGQKADGTLIFYTIDGRKAGHSIGASLTQVAQRMIELGCVTALCLDGGGSTTMTVTAPDATAAKTINRPSGGSERLVSNQIFLVATNQPSGQLGHFYVSADNSYVLAGSKVNIAASPVDTNYIPMTSANYSLSTSAGEITDAGVLTTPSAGGEVTVTASGNGQSGSTTVHAITTPDSISVKNGATAVTSLSVAPGNSVTLTASAVYKHLALKADPEAFTWTVNGDIGTVDNTGKFTATNPGTGTLTVSAGGKSVTVNVTVSEIALSTVEDFENGVPAAADYSYGATLSGNTNSNYVRYGLQSGKLDYTLDAANTSTLAFATPYSIGTAYSQLSLWVYGDGSNNALSIQVSDGTNVSDLSAGLLDFTGWKQISVTLPAGTSFLNGLKISGGGGTFTMEDGSEQTINGAPSGTLYLDQIVGAYNNIVDTTVPVVSLSVSGTALTATITDKGDKHPAQSGVSLTMDGKSIAFTYDASKGALSATLPITDANAHRVTVTAKDASGNIGRASYDVAATGGTAQFTDTANYWAGSYVDWLKTAGITTGYEDGSFRPNQSITRQQFAVMLYRYLGLDGAQYESVELPFADNGQIGDYARTAIKTLYTKGIINGSTGTDGKLYFNPGSSLTRAQAATMIGRTQQQGYATVTLSFTDAKSIPPYAAQYIQTMVAQKVISGYEDGTFKPNANITRGQMAKILYNLL